MVNLAVDLLDKLDCAGFPVKQVCRRAGVSPSTVTVLRRGETSCSQKTYDRIVGALIKMVHERNQLMREKGLWLPGSDACSERPEDESSEKLKVTLDQDDQGEEGQDGEGAAEDAI